jgi:hypothetical protein
MIKYFRILKGIYQAKTPHYLSVPFATFRKLRLLIWLMIKLNKNYVYCEIFRKKFKLDNNFVVVGLKWSGKNVKRRTNGFAKEFVLSNEDARCIYCEKKLNLENATTDHIVPISKCGTNVKVNLIACCKKCNSEKSDSDFFEYLRYKNPKYKKIKYPFF